MPLTLCGPSNQGLCEDRWVALVDQVPYSEAVRVMDVFREVDCRHDNPVAGCGDGDKPRIERGTGKRLSSSGDKDLALAPKTPVFNSGDCVQGRSY